MHHVVKYIFSINKYTYIFNLDTKLDYIWVKSGTLVHRFMFDSNYEIKTNKSCCSTFYISYQNLKMINKLIIN